MPPPAAARHRRPAAPPAGGAAAGSAAARRRPRPPFRRRSHPRARCRGRCRRPGPDRTGGDSVVEAAAREPIARPRLSGGGRDGRQLRFRRVQRRQRAGHPDVRQRARDRRRAAGPRPGHVRDVGHARAAPVRQPGRSAGGGPVWRRAAGRPATGRDDRSYRDARAPLARRRARPRFRADGRSNDLGHALRDPRRRDASTCR